MPRNSFLVKKTVIKYMWMVLDKAIMESVSKNEFSITDVCLCMSDDVLTFMNNFGS